MRYDYALCGWHVRSALPLPELIAWDGPTDSPADVTIAQGVVPEKLDHPVSPGKYLAVGADGEVLLHIRDLVRILVQGGDRITVQILRETPGNEWRLFLLGSGLAHLCLQRGLFALHAATVQLAERTVAIAGHTGAGKSTLSMALVKRGHRLLSDDLAVLRPASSSVEVLPSFPRLKLWRDSLERLQISTVGLSRVREALEKYDVRPQAAFDPAPKQLHAIVVLHSGPDLRLTRLGAVAAVPVLNAHISRPRVAAYLGRRADLFRQSALVAQAVPVFHLVRTQEMNTLHEAASLLEEKLAA